MNKRGGSDQMQSDPKQDQLKTCGVGLTIMGVYEVMSSPKVRHVVYVAI